jgi:hypothetical protein
MEGIFYAPAVVLTKSGLYKSVDFECDATEGTITIPAQPEPYIVVFMAERVWLQQDNLFFYVYDLIGSYSDICNYNWTIIEHMIANRQSVGFSDMKLSDKDYRAADWPVKWERPPIL